MRLCIWKQGFPRGSSTLPLQLHLLGAPPLLAGSDVWHGKPSCWPLSTIFCVSSSSISQTLDFWVAFSPRRYEGGANREKIHATFATLCQLQGICVNWYVSVMDIMVKRCFVCCTFRIATMLWDTGHCVSFLRNIENSNWRLNCYQLGYKRFNLRINTNYLRRRIYDTCMECNIIWNVLYFVKYPLKHWPITCLKTA